MDRRQTRSRMAIFSAFSELLSKTSFSNITVQDIIDRANVGRSTFYAHFPTKETLLSSLCAELFGHIVDSAADIAEEHPLFFDDERHASVFCHLLHHIEENDLNIIGLLSSESGALFLGYFKDNLQKLISTRLEAENFVLADGIPREFLVNHIAGSFVEMVLWWIQGGRKETPEELERWFLAVIAPVGCPLP